MLRQASLHTLRGWVHLAVVVSVVTYWLAGECVDAVPVPRTECGFNARSIREHCVCDEGFVCSGSKCSHAVSAKFGISLVVKLPQGFPKSGTHQCIDCSCVAEPHPTATATEAPKEQVKLRMFAGIKSGTGEKYRERRNQWRKSGCPKMYADAKIGYKFFVGVPLDMGHELNHHNQGGHDTPHERELEHSLEEEYNEFRDIELLPFRDTYMDISNKLLGILRYGYRQTNADYIIEHDDEFCMNIPIALGVAAKHEKDNPTHELYAGTYHWKGTEYESMKGVTGIIAPYFSGWCSFLSRRLVGLIVDTDWAHTVLVGQYGTTADDANTGKWVQYAQQQHGVEVDFVGQGMVTDIDKMK